MRTTLLLLLALLFSACSSNVFNPEAVIGKREIRQEGEKHVAMQHVKGITYTDGTILQAKGLIEGLKLPVGFSYLNDDQAELIAADNGGGVLIVDKETKELKNYALSKRVLSASKEENLLATVNVKNEMELFDLDTNKTIFKYAGSEVIAVDIRLANPRFYDDLIFFPTLDGKVQIYSKTKGEMVRTMSVSTEDAFNNIIFFKLFKKKIIAATGSALYLFSADAKKEKMPIRSVLFHNESLIVLSKDGKISRWDLDLEIQKEIKLKFAYLLGGVIKGEKLYVVENEGYLIEVLADIETYNIYKLDFDAGAFFSGTDRFYFSNGYFKP